MTLYDAEAVSWINLTQYEIVMAAGVDDANAGGGPGDGAGAVTDAITEEAAGTETSPTDGAAEETSTDGAASGSEDATPVVKEPWFQKRINKLTADKSALAGENATLKQQLEALRAGQQTGEARYTQAELEAEVKRRSVQEVGVSEFNKRCEAVVTSGRETFQDFDAQVQNLWKIRDSSSPQEMTRFNDFIAAMLDTGAAPKLIHHLGQDLDTAAKLFEMPPAKMGIELARLADLQASAVEGKDAAAGAAGAAARPVRPIGQRGPQNTPIDPRDNRSDTLDTAEWMRRREAQMAGQVSDRRRSAAR